MDVKLLKIHIFRASSESNVGYTGSMLGDMEKFDRAPSKEYGHSRLGITIWNLIWSGILIFGVGRSEKQRISHTIY